MSALTNGFAYKWAQNTNTKTRPSKFTNERNTKKDENVSNLSSSSSSLSSSQSTIYRDLSDERLPKKRKGHSDAASTESLTHQLGTPLPHRSQPIYSKQAPSQSAVISHPSLPATRGPQVTVTYTIVSLAPSTSITASRMHSNTTHKVSTAKVIISPSGIPLPADIKLAPIFLGKEKDTVPP